MSENEEVEGPDYGTWDPKGWCGDPRRGAAMGRITRKGELEGPLTVKEVYLYDGAYDRNGTYFGAGDRLFWVASNDSEVDYIMRAANRKVAIMVALEDYPGAEISPDDAPIKYTDEELLLLTDDEDECPLCYEGTVEHVEDEVRCMGMCGATAVRSQG